MAEDEEYPPASEELAKLAQAIIDMLAERWTAWREELGPFHES